MSKSTSNWSAPGPLDPEFAAAEASGTAPLAVAEEVELNRIVAAPEMEGIDVLHVAVPLRVLPDRTGSLEICGRNEDICQSQRDKLGFQREMTDGSAWLCKSSKLLPGNAPC
jgi:hypothetical protein